MASKTYYSGWTQNPLGPRVIFRDRKEAVLWAETITRDPQACGYAFIENAKTRQSAMFSDYKRAWSSDLSAVA